MSVQTAIDVPNHYDEATYALGLIRSWLLCADLGLGESQLENALAKVEFFIEQEGGERYAKNQT